MHRIIAALLAATSCVATVKAQDNIAAAPQPAGPVLTLDRAVRLASGSAPAAEAAQAGIDAARASRIVAGLRPNPSLETQIENIAGTGPYNGFEQTETTIGLNIPIELGGKRAARIAAADVRSSRAMLMAAITQADIRLQVTQFYVEAVAAQRRLATVQDQLRITRDAANAARVRVQAGRASPLEEQRANVMRVNAEVGVERAQRLAEVARHNLARRIGQPLAGSLDETMLDRLPAAGHGPAQPAGIARTMALAAADADLAVADAGVRLARSQRVPDLTVGPGIRRLEATNDTAAVFSISVPIPFFNSGRAAVEESTAERHRAVAQRRMTALDVEQAIAEAEAEAANAATTARAANGPALSAAQEAARIARIGYREGKFGQLDLLDAERALAETRLAAIDALAAYQNARARLERLTAAAPASAPGQGN